MIRTTHRRRAFGDLTDSIPGAQSPSAAPIAANLTRLQTTLSTQQRDAIRSAFIPSARPGHTFNAPATAERCDCMINKLDTHLIENGANPVTWQERDGLMARCASDWSSFVSFLVQEVGMPTLRVDSCRPWYERRTLWALAGAALVVGGGVTLAMRMKRRGTR